jgi:Ala-tRNA(Pro) deacylase
MSKRLARFLKERELQYEIVHHMRDYTARETALDTETPPREFAKTVFLRVDDGFAMAVLPASEFISEKRLREALPAHTVRLASEEEIAPLCPDCALGAAPPFGNLYGLPVYVSPILAKCKHITFNAGTHVDAIRMAYEDYERAVAPTILPLSRHDAAA